MEALLSRFRLWMVVVGVGVFVSVLWGCIGGEGEARERIRQREMREKRGRSRSYVVDIDGNRWSDVAIVEIPNEDTLSSRDMTIFVKHQPYEQIDSLGVTIYMVAPDEATYSEHMTLRFEGCRRGLSVVAHLHEVPYRQDVVLRQRGLYKMYIFPSAPLRGIEGVGVILE